MLLAPLAAFALHEVLKNANSNRNPNRNPNPDLILQAILANVSPRFVWLVEANYRNTNPNPYSDTNLTLTLTLTLTLMFPVPRWSGAHDAHNTILNLES